MKRRALEGIRVLEASLFWAGPYSTRLLADMGAEVIKVESAGRPDLARDLGELPRGVTTKQPWNLRGLFIGRNRGKLGVTIDLSKEQGKALFLKLVKISDIVVDNFSARVMHNLGLDYRALQQHKPDIITLSMPASGMTGPERDYVGQGGNISQLSGLVAITGYRGAVPHQIGPYSDPVAGLTGTGAILAALFHRSKTGKGQAIDLSQREATARFIGDAIMDYTMNGRLWPLMGNRHPSSAPHDCYRCKGQDMWVAITVSSESQWHALCLATNHPEWETDARFADPLNRHQHQDELDALLTEWTVQRNHREVMAVLQEAGVPAGAVLKVPELFEDPQYAARGYFPQVTHPEAGTFPTLGVWAKFSKNPGYITRGGPMLGEHNEQVFRSLLGLSLREMEELLAQDIISADPIVP